MVLNSYYFLFNGASIIQTLLTLKISSIFQRKKDLLEKKSEDSVNIKRFFIDSVLTAFWTLLLLSSSPHLPSFQLLQVTIYLVPVWTLEMSNAHILSQWPCHIYVIIYTLSNSMLVCLVASKLSLRYTKFYTLSRVFLFWWKLNYSNIFKSTINVMFSMWGSNKI